MLFLPIRTLLLVSTVALVCSSAPADAARYHHGKSINSGDQLTDVSASRRHRRHVSHRFAHDVYRRHYSARHHRYRHRVVRAVDREQIQDRTSAAPQTSFFGNGLVAEARRYLGTNPTGRSRLWCGNFMNLVLKRSGLPVTGSNMARSFASYGHRVSGPQIGAIAVMSRGRRGGHVGVVSGIDPHGNPIIISGNHGRRVAESVYSRGRIYAYVMP